MSHPVILFDGICNLCNASVVFIIKRDKKGLFRFATLQSDFARQLIAKHYSGKLPLPDSVVLFQDGVLYTESTAALRIAKKLDGLWPLWYGFIIVPRFLRDAVYNFIAENRYRWFGKREACMVPTPELKQRFVAAD